MKSLNDKSTLWSDITSEAMEIRDEYGTCFWSCIDCFCIDCIQCVCVCVTCIF